MASFDNEQINVDLSALPPNVPSLCIPRVFKNITRERVMSCFKDLNLGFVERVDMVPRKSENGDEFQRVFIHLRWNKSEQSSKARSRVLTGKEIKIIYDEPWFWKVSANRSVSRDSSASDSRDSRIPRATLALEDDDLEGSVRKMKNSARAQNDRKDGYKPRQYESSDRRPQQHRPQQKQEQKQWQKQEFRPRSPSSSPPPSSPLSSPPPPIVTAEAFVSSNARASTRSPSLELSAIELATDFLNSLDIDASPRDAGFTLNYGDSIVLPLPKKRRVIKPKIVVASSTAESLEVKGLEVANAGLDAGLESGEEV